MKKSIYTEKHKYLVRQLKKARLEAKLNQIETARLLGKNQSFISKVEAGQRRLDFLELQEFARIYKKKINFFIRQ